MISSSRRVNLTETLEISYCFQKHSYPHLWKSVWRSAFSLITKTAPGQRHYNFSFADGEISLERLISSTIWGYWMSVAFRRRVQISFMYNCSPFSILSPISVKTKSQLSGTHSSGRNPSQRGRWGMRSQVGWHSRTWGPEDTGWKCGRKVKIVVTLFPLTLTQFLGCSRR